MTTVGILHPGSMGAAVAHQLVARGMRVLWCSAGRSAATIARADKAGLEAVPDLTALVSQSAVIISLCPPAAAESVARDVAMSAWAGLIYVEANAITPDRVKRIEQVLAPATVVDAAVIGSPPADGVRTALYICGQPAAVGTVAGFFEATDVDVRALGTESGKASALKMAYTTFQKTSRVLAAIAYATAEANGLAGELLKLAAKRPGSYLNETEYIPTTAALAWRWGPELAEAADYARANGFPGEIMQAAAAALSRWDHIHDAELSLAEVLARLNEHGSTNTAQRHGSKRNLSEGQHHD